MSSPQKSSAIGARALIQIAIVAVVCAFAGSYLARLLLLNWTEGQRAAVHAPPPGEYARIVSLAPSITEILFALELGDRVAGVTRYCDYPPEAKEKADIGGFLDINYEAILGLKPDLVIALAIHHDAADRIRGWGIPVLQVEHRTFPGILESIRVVGDTCGAREKADSIVAELEARIERVKEKTAGASRPRVLLSSGRSLGTGRIGEVYVAGRNQWYDDIIALAGGVNAYEDETVQFPNVSGEGLLRLNPDVIIDMAPELYGRNLTVDQVAAEWNSLPSITAVKNGRVHVLTADYVTVPGPRFVDTLEDVAQALHPELDWEAE